MSPSTHPFLPEPEPQPPAPQRRGARTLILWIVLIVMFLAIWQFLSPSEPPGRHAAPPPPSAADASFWSTALVTLLPMTFIGLMFVLFLRKLRQPVRLYGDFNVAQEPGQRAMAEGRFAQAAQVYVQLGTQYAKQPLYRFTAQLHAARAQLRAGDLDAAIATLARAEKGSGLLFSVGVRSLAAAELAFAHALADQLPVAERWATEARARLVKNREPRMTCAALLTLADAVVLLRRGQTTAALALFDEHWLVLRETLTGNQMRAAEVLRAFAEAGAGPRGMNQVAERLVRIEPTVPGELAFLGTRWPEMHAFLAAHGLGATAGASAASPG